MSYRPSPARSGARAAGYGGEGLGGSPPRPWLLYLYVVFHAQSAHTMVRLTRSI